MRGQIVDMAAHPGGRGYWLLGQDGAVYPHGDARDLGQGAFADQSAIAIGATPSGNGYFIASDKGDVQAFGDAVAQGSLDKKDLKRKIADMAVTPSGNGYWLVDENGQVFAFGDAAALGSSAGKRIVAIGATPRGDGYWLVEDSGAVTAFGAAPTIGSLSDPAKKIVDMTPTSTGRGYWLVDRDGLVFPLGDAVSYGQLAKKDLKSGQIVAIVSTPFVNHDPVAATDNIALDEDTSVDIDVLANDTDEDGDPISVAVLTQPAHGTASLNANGTIHYVPAHDYNGPDSFTYKVSDGVGGSAVGTVNLTIRPVNDAPVANDDAFTADEDTGVTGSLVANDTDVDGDALTGVLVAGPAHGTVALGAAGSFTYTPAANFNGDDSFTYQASDSQLTSNTATVRIHLNPVNDAPVAVADSGSLDEDTTLTVVPQGVLSNDSDVDGDALRAVLGAPPAHGAVTLLPSGGYAYTPAANYNGADTFTYHATDGLLDSGTVTVALTIKPVNDPPVAAKDSYDTVEDMTLVVGAPGVLANDSDVDGDALTAVVVQTPAHGTLTLLPDGSFTYAPAANFNGTDQFTYTAYDGQLASGETTVTISVSAVNDPPVAVPDAYTVDEDTTLLVGSPGVMANDSDVDGDALQVRMAERPQHGEVALLADGSFEYTPDPNYNGTDSFTYDLSDGSYVVLGTTVTITVNPVNDPPTANDDSYTARVGTTLSIDAPGVMSNDFDDSGSLTAVLVTTTTSGALTLNPDGSFTYTTTRTAAGSDSFTYKVTDGTTDSAPATVSISVLAASGGGGGGTFGGYAQPVLVVWDFDSLKIAGGSGTLKTKHGKVVQRADGTFYVPERGFRGRESFDYGGRHYEVDVISDVWGD